MTTPQTLLKTPLHQFHVNYGAKLVDFVGWEMPLLYTSIIEEHRQVRSSGGRQLPYLAIASSTVGTDVVPPEVAISGTSADVPAP